MKKALFITFGLVVFIVIGWLILRRSKVDSPPPVPLPTLIQTSNVPIVQPPSVILESANNTSELVRPSSVDEATWKKYISYRQIVLGQNQPVEFYARVVDQDEQPVAGAELKISLVRWNEDIFVASNYLHWDAGAAHQQKFFDLYSDANGWIQLTGETGSFLDMTGLSKDGYLSSYPNGNFGGVHYESRGVRTPTQDILMTNSWNPQKGYTLHLWKKGDTERLVRIKFGVGLPDNGHQAWFNLFNHEISNLTSEWADFTVVETLVHPEDANKQYDRSICIRGVNGAKLLETRDFYPYLATNTEYAEEYKFDVLPSTGNGPEATWDWAKNFYVTARSGKVYAGLKVSFVAGKLSFGFDGYLNPNGSRNLQPDPDKLITDPAEVHAIDLATRPQ